jgi:hypothetical protein
MSKEVLLSSYWLPVLRELKEFKEIAKAEEPEIILLLKAVDKTLNDMYIQTAEEDGIARFEKLLGLYPAPEDSLDTRRFRVQTKWNDQLPYTEEELHTRLISLCGEGGYVLNISYSKYTLDVAVALNNKDALSLVQELLDQMVPCNMIVTARLQYNTYAWLANRTHSELSTFTYTGIRETPMA